MPNGRPAASRVVTRSPVSNCARPAEIGGAITRAFGKATGGPAASRSRCPARRLGQANDTTPAFVATGSQRPSRAC